MALTSPTVLCVQFPANNHRANRSFCYYNCFCWTCSLPPNSPHQLLVVTSKSLYLIPLPLNIIAVKSDSGAMHSLVLPRLEATTQIEVPSLDMFGASEDGGVRTFRAGRRALVFVHYFVFHLTYLV